MWDGPNAACGNILRGNGLPRCCGKEPTLRVDGESFLYQCRVCGDTSDPATNEVEARLSWRDQHALRR